MSDGSYCGASFVGIRRIFAPQTEVRNFQKNETERRPSVTRTLGESGRYEPEEETISNETGSGGFSRQLLFFI